MDDNISLCLEDRLKGLRLQNVWSCYDNGVQFDFEQPDGLTVELRISPAIEDGSEKLKFRITRPASILPDRKIAAGIRKALKRWKNIPQNILLGAAMIATPYVEHLQLKVYSARELSEMDFSQAGKRARIILDSLKNPRTPATVQAALYCLLLPYMHD